MVLVLLIAGCAETETYAQPVSYRMAMVRVCDQSGYNCQVVMAPYYYDSYGAYYYWYGGAWVYHGYWHGGAFYTYAGRGNYYHGGGFYHGSGSYHSGGGRHR